MSEERGIDPGPMDKTAHDQAILSGGGGAGEAMDQTASLAQQEISAAAETSVRPRGSIVDIKRGLETRHSPSMEHGLARAA